MTATWLKPYRLTAALLIAGATLTIWSYRADAGICGPGTWSKGHGPTVPGDKSTCPTILATTVSATTVPATTIPATTVPATTVEPEPVVSVTVEPEPVAKPELPVVLVPQVVVVRSQPSQASAVTFTLPATL